MAISQYNTQELVKISGKGALLNVQVDDRAPLETVCRTLRERLARDRNLYSEGNAIVDIGRRLLSADQQDRIRKVVEAESGLRIQKFLCDPTILAEECDRIAAIMSEQQAFFPATAKPVVAVGANGHASEPDDAHPAGDGVAPPLMGHALANGQPGSQGAPAHIAHGTYRSGDTATFPGNAVVIGNVNPGARVIARGDIIVYGTLRGLAHAGAGGDASAVILAMSAINPQLRIAQFIWDDERPETSAGPRGARRHVPIIAQVMNRSVRVSPYPRQNAINNGGNLNER